MNGVSKKDEKGYGPRKEAGVVFRWSGVTLAKYTIPLPTFAFIVCVLISLYKDFDRSTATHCKVSTNTRKFFFFNIEYYVYGVGFSITITMISITISHSVSVCIINNHDIPRF